MSSTRSAVKDMVESAVSRVTHPFAVMVVVLCVGSLVYRQWVVPFVSNVRLALEFLCTPVPKLTISVPSTVKDAPFSPAKEHEIQCFDPSTLQHLGSVPILSKEEIDGICKKARTAQPAWAKTSYRQRRLVLRTIQRYILSHVELICEMAARDSGKCRVDALLGEVLTTCEKIRTLNLWGEAWLQPDHRPVGLMMLHKTAYVQYVPCGVLGVLAPWNYPFHNLYNHILSGLFAGNAVVVKVSEHTSYSSLFFIQIAQQALSVHGHDSNVVQILTGLGETGQALVQCPYVDKIIFTGSPRVGRLVMRGCCTDDTILKPVVLELGGKDAMVFCDDVKFEDVLPWAMRGCFQNAGQNCCGVERVFVYESIHAKFINAILPRVKALRQGNPLEDNVDCGSMTMSSQIALIQELVDDAVDKGAKVHCGGRQNPHLQGQFYEPTLIAGVTREMRISQEEVFGPVMCVMMVPDDDDEECIRLVNDCNFGLGCSVYSASQQRALAIGQQIRSGMCTVNDFAVNYLIQSLPFGGIKESGFGRFAGPEGLRACCLERSMVVDRLWGVRTTIPQRLDYPMDGVKGFCFGKALLQLFYEEGVMDKIRGILGLIKHG